MQIQKSRRAKIREMSIDDLPAVYHLGEELFTSEEFPILYRTWDMHEVTEYFDVDPDYCLVAEINKEIVGFIIGTTITKGTAWNYGYIAWIGVKPEFQRVKLGRRLYREVEKRMKREEGARMMIADTDSNDKDAICFFEKMGFLGRKEHLWLIKTLGKKRK